MKLSEAIRLGSLMSPQHFGGSMDGAGRCALGAAADAAGLEKSALGTVPYVRLREHFPVLGLPFGPSDVMRHIVNLNDIFRHTREQIADWVAIVERRAELIAAPAPVQEQPQDVAVLS